MTIHWCGTGLSSAPGLRRLIEAGHKVVVWNRTVEKAREAVGDLTQDIRPYALADLGGDWNESAAISADRRWAAVSQRDAVRLYDLKYAQPLVAPRAMSLPAVDTLTELGFSADGRTLLARSHFGYRFALPLLTDQRPNLWSVTGSVKAQRPYMQSCCYRDCMRRVMLRR